MNRLKKYIKDKFMVVGLIILLTLILPMFFDVLNWGRYIPFYKNTSADGWLSFLGSSFGFIIIVITIKHERKQFNEDKRVNIKPYLEITLEGVKESEWNSSFGSILINDTQMNRNIYKDHKINVVMTNLGLGHCLGCMLIKMKLNSNMLNKETIYIGNIKIDSTKKYKLEFRVWYGDIQEKLKKQYIDKYTQYDKQIEDEIYKETLNTLELLLEYKDTLGNKYNKTIVLNISINFGLVYDDTYKVKGVDFNFVNIVPDEKSEKETCFKIKS